MTYSVKFKNITKKYKMYDKASEKFKDIFTDKYGKDFYALQNINFTANQGDVIGVIGINGSGKSTMSNLLAGITPETSGEISIEGQASLIAIASGLNTQLTGRDNIEMKCLMLGFSKKEIINLMPDIIEFSELGTFIDQPVKKYSSGMKSRLGFAISVNIDPDILIIDEALSVGDKTFTEKCMTKMNEFKDQGKTIFFISHSIKQIKTFCKKAMWLEAGQIKAYGSVKEVVPEYEKFLKDYKAMSNQEKKNFKAYVDEQRSALQTPQTIEKEPENHDEKEKVFVSRIDRNHRKSSHSHKKYRFILLMIAVILLASAVAFFIKHDNSSSHKQQVNNSENQASQNEKTGNSIKNKHENDNTSGAKSKGNKTDIRYVTVGSAYIRKEPNSEGEALDVASLGDAFEILKTRKEDDTKWFKVDGDNLSEKGWISSNTMKKIDKEVDDQKTADSIDDLIGFSPTLNKAIPVLGKDKGDEQAFEYTEYTYQHDKVVALTITVSDSTEDKVVEELGEPQLKNNDTLLYHGKNNDFLFTLSDDGTIDKLKVSQVQQ